MQEYKLRGFLRASHETRENITPTIEQESSMMQDRNSNISKTIAYSQLQALKEASENIKIQIKRPRIDTED